MHLAIQNSYPNLSISAEKEFIARVKIAGRDLGWQVSEVVTSDDIIACNPDMVLATHEFSPKLTHFPTIGVIWSPNDYFGEDRLRLQNILSYDGCLVATPSLRKWTTEFFAKHGKLAPISTFNFLPTAINIGRKTPVNDPSLFYAGVHWDGKRHGDLFTELEGRCPLQIYGKQERWKGKTKHYVGSLPFDGTSVVQAISNCGITLALHTEHHRRANVPSMRLFEGAAAGAVVIADRMAFCEDNFGENVLWVDVDQPAKDVAAQIASHVEWVRSNPDQAQEMATRANDIFVEKFNLHDQLAQLPAFLDHVVNTLADPVAIRTKSISNAGEVAKPRVDVIIRIGSRPVDVVGCALRSVAQQTYPNIGLILVKFRDIEGLQNLIKEYEARFTSVLVIEAPDDGIRSTALWAGLNATTGMYVCNLDDDDTIHPGHISALVAQLENAPNDVPLAYTGTIEIQEEDGFWFDQPNFNGDLTDQIKERRRLRFMDTFSEARMKKFDNFVNSNAWMAKRSALTHEILQDPQVSVAEDVYLYLMLMRQGPFVFVPVATAEWRWRSKSRDNSMFLNDLFDKDGRKVAQLLKQFGALEGVDKSILSDIDVVSKLRRIIRKPSLLLGSYAPRWRRFRQEIRNKTSNRDKS